jgi:hypothetical protein
VPAVRSGSGSIFTNAPGSTKVANFEAGYHWIQEEVIGFALCLRTSLSTWLDSNPTFALAAHRKLNDKKPKPSRKQKKNARLLAQHADEVVEEDDVSFDEDSDESVNSDRFEDDSHLFF